MGLWQQLRCLIAMGICLDTGYRRENLPLDDLTEKDRSSTTPVVRNEPERPMGSMVANTSLMSQESANAAVVIFFLGGPGSGKTSHSQNLADLHLAYRHINMVVIMSEYVKENALGPPENLSPAVALALLAREFQNSSQCRAFLITGYPRHLPDLQLYTEKLGQPTGAILLEWEKRALVRNIELGRLDGAILLEYQEAVEHEDEDSNLGYMVAEAARRELSDFYAKVLPVCENLDNLGILYVVSGERSQEEIFRDVQKSHSLILRPNLTHPPSRTSIGSYREFRQMVPFAVLNDVVHEASSPLPVDPEDMSNNNLPPCIFLMGGPGSNKGSLLKEMMYLYPGWAHINVGGTLRTRVTSWRRGHASPEGLPSDKLELIENILAKGDLVSQDLIMELLSHRIQDLSKKEGIIIVGFPRDVIQAQSFEERFGHVPPLILLDCSELELGRSLGRRETRIDDNVAAAHRRLNIYRQVTLPMLKAFDEKNRLRIIDGDQDIDQVTKELKRAIYVETKMLGKRRDRSAQHMLNNKPSRPSMEKNNEDSFSDEFSADEKIELT